MKYKEPRDIPFPNTVEEANEAFNALVTFFGYGEKLSFDKIECEKDSVWRVRIALDILNESITIFHFNWTYDEPCERTALDCFTYIHLEEDEAVEMADAIRYFAKIIKRLKGGKE